MLLMGYIVGRAATIGVDKPALYVLRGLMYILSPRIRRRATGRLRLGRLVALVRLLRTPQGCGRVAARRAGLRLLAQRVGTVGCGRGKSIGLAFCAHILPWGKQVAYHASQDRPPR
jgi:hypothetical protein